MWVSNPTCSQRPRNQPVLRLHFIVLTPGTLNVVARPFTLQMPLLIEQFSLRLKFPNRLDRHGDLFRCECIKQYLFDMLVDR